MKKYEYTNATVYITVPTEKQLQNIHKATEWFAKKLIEKGIDIYGRNHDGNRSSRKNANGQRKGTRKTERNNR